MKKLLMIASVALAGFVAVSTSAANSFVYTSGLIKVGSHGTQVYELQRCLVDLGVNSASNVDGIFGLKTKAAVMAFQAEHGLMVDGIVGPQTGPVYTKVCAEANNGTTTTTTTISSKDKEFVLGGEGDISDYDFNKEDDADANSNDEEVATIEFEVEDGDVELEKVELFFEEEDVNNDLWDNIESIRLEVDGKEISNVDVDNKRDWKDHGDKVNDDKDIYSITLTGSEVFEKGDDVEISVILETTDEVESGDDAEKYNVWAELRFVNAKGVQIFEGEDEKDDDDAVSVSIEGAEEFDMDLSENNDSPDDDDSLDLSEDIDGETLVILDAEVEDNQDGTLEEAVVKIKVTMASGKTGDVDELIDEVALLIDGKEIDTDDADTTVDDSGVEVKYTFDLDDYEVKADKEYEIEVKADFNEIDDDSDFVGAKIEVASISIDGEDAAGDDFDTVTEGTSFAPEFTATAGAIDVTWEDAVVYSDGKDNTSTGDYILFSVDVENNTGSDITGLKTITNWEFDVDGYGVDFTKALVAGDDDWTIASNALPVVGTEAEDTLEDGDSIEYFFMLPYLSTSSKDFTIELEELGGIAVADTWEE